MFSMRKGQSAIEYLTTYGWMLLVVAIVGGAIFSTVQNSSQVQTTSGLANADVQVSDFGVTESGFQAELRAGTSDQIEDVNFTITDPETGETVSQETNAVPVGDTETVSLDKVESSESTNTYNIKIRYDTGGLEELEETGTITGQIEINSSSGSNDISTMGTVSINPDIGGASVEAYSDGSLVETTTTDSNGEYSFSTSPGSIDRLVVNSENDISLNGQPLYAGAEITSFSSSPVNFNFNESAAWTNVEINGTNTTVANQLESSGGEPYPIANVEMLQAMQEDVNANYTVVRNFSASETQNWNYNGSVHKGFDPVGPVEVLNFDGEGHKIDGLYINRSEEDWVGLLSEEDGSCEDHEFGNLTISNWDINGYYAVGYITGEERTTGFINSSTISKKVSNDLSGFSAVGQYKNGLVGEDGSCAALQ